MSASRPRAHIGLRQTICSGKVTNYFWNDEPNKENNLLTGVEISASIKTEFRIFEICLQLSLEYTTRR